MPLLGAHMSIAGGYYKAADAAHAVGCDCVQLFTKNNNQWRAKEISQADVAAFQGSMAKHGLAHPISHASYLINLASGNEELWEKSVDAMAVELQRAEQLGIPYVVVHPGAYTDLTPEAGVANVIRGLDAVHDRIGNCSSGILLETTAGQGSSLGCTFEHLAAMILGAKQGEKIGVCVDTCHLFAAGYALIERSDYLAVFREFDRTIGLDRIRAFHLNDSKKPLGSRVDRHEHIGQGHLGLEPFRHLLNDKRFRSIPMYLETPKGTHEGEDCDIINLRTLRSLVE